MKLKTRYRYLSQKPFFIKVVCAAFISLYTQSSMAIQFEEVAVASGINYIGESWGASWGDANGDGLPDLWTSNHKRCPALYINQGDGTFTNQSDSLLPASVCEPQWLDLHGAAWADFDNDGDQDLIQLVDIAPSGFSRSNLLLINNNGIFSEEASVYGVSYAAARSRMPLWFDHNNDGLLDLLNPTSYTSAGQLPTALFEQHESGFADISLTVQLNLYLTTNVAQFVDITGNGLPDLTVESDNRFPYKIYDVTTTPFTVDQFTPIPVTSQVRDTVIADLDGDLKNDMLMVFGEKVNDVIQMTTHNLRARIRSNNTEFGFTFKSSGDISISLYPLWKWKTAKNIFIGAAGTSSGSASFTMQSSDPAVIGIATYTPGTSKGMYTGYDPDTQTWSIYFSNSDAANIVIDGTNPITEIKSNSIELNSLPPAQKYITHSNGNFVDQTDSSGFTAPASARDIVAGDFDNDMDLDLYMVSTGAVTNLPNLLYENQGDGTFIRIPDAGGASGTLLGRGDVVAMADYNNDGFLDLLVTNGKSKEPFDRDGPVELFRNTGNGNKWLEIDLEGVLSNREGIGAKVIATAGGISQLREQSGGIHYRTQNHSRLHFGMANKNKAALYIEWPSGIVQNVPRVPTNQIIKIVEPVTASLKGKPQAMLDGKEGVMIWKDYFDGPYQLRAQGGGEKTVLNVDILATVPFTELIPMNLESNDTWVAGPSSFSLDAAVSVGNDGAKFKLPANAHALLAVSKGDISNPRQIKVGTNSTPLTPSGWILNSNQLVTVSSLQGGVDLGLFIGHGDNPTKISAQWNGDGQRHDDVFSLLAAEAFTSVQLQSIENSDQVTRTDRYIQIEGAVSTWWDGVDVQLPVESMIGFTFQQDGLFQSPAVNPDTQNLGRENAYWLPRTEPYGAPNYDANNDTGLYLWKDISSQVWRVRASNGTTGQHYTGVITSDMTAESIINISTDSSDVVDSSDPNRIVFDLVASTGNDHGFDFKFPAEATITVKLSSPGKSSIKVGADQWPVQKLPLDISGW